MYSVNLSLYSTQARQGMEKVRFLEKDERCQSLWPSTYIICLCFQASNTFRMITRPGDTRLACYLAPNCLEYGLKTPYSHNFIIKEKKGRGGGGKEGEGTDKQADRRLGLIVKPQAISCEQ